MLGENYEDEDSGGGGGAPAWMATMADMFSLLLTFFVLLLSFSNMDVVKFRNMLGSVKDAFGVQRETPGDFEALSTTPVQVSEIQSSATIERISENPPRPVPDPPPMDPRLVKEIEDAVAKLDLGRMVEVEPTPRGVVVRVKGQLLFASGSADLLPAGRVFLDEMARLTRAFPNDLMVQGHTDDIPIETSRFPSNWYLSAHRAISALRYVTEHGGVPGDRVSAAGFADTRPIVPNDSAANRAENRRVEFVYLRDAASRQPKRGSARF